MSSVKVETVYPGSVASGLRITVTPLPEISIVPSEPGEEEALTLVTAVNKVHAQIEIEALRIVQQPSNTSFASRPSFQNLSATGRQWRVSARGSR